MKYTNSNIYNSISCAITFFIISAVYLSYLSFVKGILDDVYHSYCTWHKTFYDKYFRNWKRKYPSHILYSTNSSKSFVTLVSMEYYIRYISIHQHDIRIYELPFSKKTVRIFWFLVMNILKGVSKYKAIFHLKQTTT